MTNTYKANTEFANVGDVVKVRIDKRDVKIHPSMFKYVIGVVYQQSSNKFAYVVTPHGIFAKQSLGGKKGLKPYTISPRDYVIANQNTTLSYDVESLREKVVSVDFDINNYQLVTTAKLRTSIAKS